MSDNWITLVPEDPYFIPDMARQSRARERLTEIAPDADEVEITLRDTVQFFDCGTNLERILCPACGAELPVDWWQERMNEDYQQGFKLAPYQLPCCGATSALHELIYDGQQAFGHFALDVMNPNIGMLDDTSKRELEEILGTKLIVVYQHL